MRTSRRRRSAALYARKVGLEDLYEFYLVPVDPDQRLSIRDLSRIRTLLLEFQPAKSVSLVGQPASAIRVVAFGGTEVAPGLLSDLSQLAGVELHVRLSE